MSFILGQYNHAINKNENNWMEPIDYTKVSAITVNTKLDSGVDDNSGNLIFSFEDPGLYNNSGFKTSQTYYCHCKIKRDISTEFSNMIIPGSIQEFSIELTNCELVSGTKYNVKSDSTYQFIKNIVIQQGEGNQWVDVEFIFTPQNEFNTILFTLQRTSRDFMNDGGRKPLIAFLEVSKVQNILETITNEANVNLLKMGIQSRPGLKMCINREEISIGRTGIYEIKNGEIKISFISFVVPATSKTNEELKDVVDNISYLNEVESIRPFDGFSLDYLYEKKE